MARLLGTLRSVFAFGSSRDCSEASFKLVLIIGGRAFVMTVVLSLMRLRLTAFLSVLAYLPECLP